MFKSNAEFWGWDGGYIVNEVHQSVTEAQERVTDFLAAENPLTPFVNEASAEIYSAVTEALKQHDPALRPTVRQQHGVVPVNI